MPKLPEGVASDGWDLESPGIRTTLRAALAVPIPEAEWDAYEGKPEEALRHYVGGWLFEDDDELGRAEGVDGAAGRGADAWLPVVEFVALHAAGGAIAAAAGMAFKRVWERAKGALSARDHRPRQSVLVSRGGAAFLAIAEVAERFEERETIEVEAVEEPAFIAGRDLWTLSYVGDEPWIVLLLNRERRIRYVVVVAPEGDILGLLDASLLEHEELPPLAT